MKYLSDNYTWSAAPAKWLWAVTLANIVVAGLLLAFIFQSMLVQEWHMSGWPIFTLLAVGIGLSVTVGIPMKPISIPI